MSIEKYIEKENGLDVTIHRSFLSKTNHDELFQQFLKDIPWYRVQYKSERHLNECETPCWTNFYGGFPEMKPYQPVPIFLTELSNEVSQICESPFNAVLLRLYFDGSDNITWHTDGRTFLGEEPVIASLSLGAHVTFQMRKMKNVWPTSKDLNGGVDKNHPQIDFKLKGGDMLIMAGKTQDHWHHRVPKETSRGLRLNINFRYILPERSEIAIRGVHAFYKYMVSGDNKTNNWDIAAPPFTFDEICRRKSSITKYFKDQPTTSSLSSTEAKAKTIGWSCLSCTFLNVITLKRCAICDTEKICSVKTSSVSSLVIEGNSAQQPLYGVESSNKRKNHETECTPSQTFSISKRKSLITSYLKSA